MKTLSFLLLLATLVLAGCGNSETGPGKEGTGGSAAPPSGVNPDAKGPQPSPTGQRDADSNTDKPEGSSSP